MNHSNRHFNPSHYCLTQTILVLGAVSFLLWSNSAQAVVNVNCAIGQSLQAAIDGNDPEITFTGTCHEDIEIFFAASITGSGPGTSIVNGNFLVFRGLVGLDNFKITNTGANDSILFTDESEIIATNMTFGPTTNGLCVQRNTLAEFQTSTFVASTGAAPFCANFFVGDNSHVQMQESSVTNDSANQATVAVRRDASIRFRGGNTITNNGTGRAIFISGDSSIASDATRDPTPDVYTGGVVALHNSLVQIFEGTVTVASGNALTAGVNSTIDLGDSFIGNPSNVQINGDVVAFDQSVIVPRPEVTINNSTVTCSGNSLLTNDTFNGTAQVDCSNFVVDSSTNNVGVGTRSPTAPLHVLRDDGTAQLRVEETNGAAANRILLELENSGPVSSLYTNNTTGNSWNFSHINSGFAISLVGSGRNEMFIRNTGTVEVPQGTVVHASSRSLKQDIEPVHSAQILEKVLHLPISEWSYIREPGARHVGPMSEDFAKAFGLGLDDKGISMIDVSGVALAAIQGLKAEKDAEIKALRQGQDARITSLQQDNQLIKNQLTELKQLVYGFVSQDKVALTK